MSGKNWKRTGFKWRSVRKGLEYDSYKREHLNFCDGKLGGKRGVVYKKVARKS